jgi:putative FmdB family regulatory protein
MPIYEYKCLRCDGEFEKIVKLNSPNPTCINAVAVANTKVLTRCDGDTKRIMSRTEFHLKGECWARDGYTYHDGIDRD